MKNGIAAVIASALTLCALGARAQDPAASPAPPQPRVTSSADLGPQAPPSSLAPTQPVNLGLYDDYVRQLNRRSREIARLNRVMNREGTEFSESKLQSYRSRLAGGVLLVVVGAGCVVSGAVYALVGFFSALFSAFDHGSDDEEEGGASESGGESDFHVVVPAVLITSGIAAIGIGIPLIITGASGKHRQELLRRKDEILAPFDPSAVTASVSLFGSPDGGGGLRLQVVF